MTYVYRCIICIRYIKKCVYTLQKPLATMAKHLNVRQKADAAYHESAERMKRKYAKRTNIHTFGVGEYASLRIPRIDRAATDLQRLPCVIVQVIGKAQAMYRLRCKYGVLSTCFHAGNLESFSGTYNISVDGWESQPRISLREAARQQAPWNSFTKNRCNCQPGACDTRKCHCKKKGIECSTHCHRGDGCKNKPLPPTLLCGKTVPAQHNMMKTPTRSDEETAIYCTCRTRCHSNKNCRCKAASLLCNRLCHPKHTCVNIPCQSDDTPIVVAATHDFDNEHIPTDQFPLAKYGLRAEHKTMLHSQDIWLDDAVITATQTLLQKQFPHIGGFQASVLGERLAMNPQPGEFVQIICVGGNHWICVSTVGCQPSAINVYDSLHGRLDKHTRTLIADLMQSQQRTIEVCYADVQRQSGGSDCGLFAVAFAVSICCFQDPATISFHQKDMRKHLLACLESGEITGFPTRSTGRRPKPAKECLDIYCRCRLPDDGTEMIECSICQEWFHLSCVKISQRFLTNKDLQWQCSSCK